MIGNFVAIRRGILDHLKYGWLTPNEFTVFVILLLEADSSTGMNRTNAAGIRSLTGFTEDVSKNVLKSLQDKGYIYRHIVEGSRKFYRVWIHKYEITTGKNKGLLTDISQALLSKDVNEIKYVTEAPEVPHDAPPEGTPDPPPVGQPDPPHYYKKQRKQDTETENARTQDKPSTYMSAELNAGPKADCSAKSKAECNAQTEDRNSTSIRSGDAGSKAERNAEDSARSKRSMVWDGEWKDAATWERLPEPQIAVRLREAGLKRKPEGLYLDFVDIETGMPVEWSEAYRRIGPTPNVKELQNV